MADWMMTLPFLVGLFWTIGGREGGRYFRRIGVGLAVGLYCYVYTKELVALVCIFTYWIVTSIGYGKLIAKRNWTVLALLGAFYGLASFPVSAITGSSLYLAQGLVGMIAFPICVVMSNVGKWQLHWALSEGLTGIAVTILVPWMIIAG